MGRACSGAANRASGLHLGPDSVWPSEFAAQVSIQKLVSTLLELSKELTLTICE